MSKSKQTTVYVSREKWEKLEKLLKENEDYCNDMGIDTPSKLLHVLANLGKKEFLRRVQQAREVQNKK